MKEKKIKHPLTFLASMFQIVGALLFLGLTVFFTVLLIVNVTNDTPANNFGEGLGRAILIILSIVSLPICLIFFIKNTIFGLLDLKTSLKETLKKGLMIAHIVVGTIFTIVLIISGISIMLSDDDNLVILLGIFGYVILEITSVILVSIDYSKSKELKSNELDA